MAKLKIGDSKVLESRETPDGSMIRRRRVTKDGIRFTTYERIEEPNLIVRKSSGSKEPFDRDKLMISVRRSVGKFLNSEMEVENVVSRVEGKLHELSREEVSSREIGEAILSVLSEMNEVAYVRFASVFLKFKTLDEFERVIRERRGKQEKVLGESVGNNGGEKEER